jgi:lipopolysaccharide assembly outer membrane protein LptD (OstA)
MSANMQTGEFSAPDPVTMKRADGSTVTADRAAGNFKRQEATLYGHVEANDVSGTFGLRSAQSERSKGPAKLSADELYVNDMTHLYDATGSVHYEQGSTVADAERAHLNDATHELDLLGNVHVVDGDRTLDAQKAVYNTQSGDGEADDNVTVTFPGITPSIATPKPVKIPKIP